MKNTDWKSLQINGRAPRAGEPNADEYSIRFANWAAEQVRLGKVKIIPAGDPQQVSDYYGSRI